MSEHETAERVYRQNRLAYARIAEAWRSRVSTDYDHEFHEQCRALFRAGLRGNRVLELGCGLGFDSMAFASEGLAVTATDTVFEFLRALKTASQEVRLTAMDMAKPCFRPGSFDGAYACASFLHVPRELTGATLQGLAGLLTPGGVLFIHHVASAQGLESYTVEDLLIENNPAVCFCHSEEELVALLRNTGLRVTGISRFAPRQHPSPCAVRHTLVPYQVLAQRVG